MKEFRFQDLSIDQTAEFSVILTEEKMDQFLAISGDNNPLHTSTIYAHEKKFRDRVCYGLLVSSFYSTLVGVHLPGKHCLLQGIDVSFHKPAFIGDKLTISGKVTYLNKAYQQVEVKAQIFNQASEKISQAKIKVGVLD